MTESKESQAGDVRQALADLIDSVGKDIGSCFYSNPDEAAAAILSAGWMPPAAVGALTSPPTHEIGHIYVLPHEPSTADHVVSVYSQGLDGDDLFDVISDAVHDHAGADANVDISGSALTTVALSPVPQERTEGEPALVEWTAMIWQASRRSWREVGSMGDREHAENELRYWQRHGMPGAHYRIASRTVSAWSAAVSPARTEGEEA